MLAGARAALKRQNASDDLPAAKCLRLDAGLKGKSMADLIGDYKLPSASVAKALVDTKCAFCARIV